MVNLNRGLLTAFGRGNKGEERLRKEGSPSQGREGQRAEGRRDTLHKSGRSEAPPGNFQCDPKDPKGKKKDDDLSSRGGDSS